jgi:putative oxidoreductase
MIPDRFAPQVYSIFRAVFGFLFMAHGLQKMFGMFGGNAVPLASLLGAAGIIEVVAGLLIMIGLFTRPSAFIASGEMAAAYFMAHFPKAPWPIANGGEPAALFCFAFLYIAAKGGGPWSVDALLWRPKHQRAGFAPPAGTGAVR